MARSPPVDNRRVWLGRALAPIVALLSLTLAALPALAAGPKPASKDSIELAEKLFYEGLNLLVAKDYDRALVYFKRSIEAAPTKENTLNAAHCLDKLGRYDEALEMSEELLTTFSDKLTDEDRLNLPEAIANLRAKVGGVEFSGQVAGRIVVDGRDRGELPRDGPLRVMPGTRKIRVVRDGFEPFERTVEVAAGGLVIITVPPPVLPPPPRPPRPPPHTFVTAYTGYAITDSLASTAETSSDEDSTAMNGLSSHKPVSGFMAGARIGYRFASNLAVELSLGYLYAVSRFERKPVRKFGATSTQANYDLSDELLFRGPFVGFGASYRIEFNPRFAFLARATAGVLSALSRHRITGTVSTSSPTGVTTAPIHVDPPGRPPIAQPAFIMPEIGVEAGWGRLRAGLLLGLVIVTSDGPSLRNRVIGVTVNCKSGGTAVGCVPNERIADGGSADSKLFGRFVLWVPQITVGYSFW